jgi:hypothetical protein
MGYVLNMIIMLIQMVHMPKIVRAIRQESITENCTTKRFGRCLTALADLIVNPSTWHIGESICCKGSDGPLSVRWAYPWDLLEMPNGV